MMPVAEKTTLKDIQAYMPLGCTEAPAHNSAFCEIHTRVVADMGYPINVRQFIQASGGDPSHYTKECKEKVKRELKQILRAQGTDVQTETADVSQGTRYLLRNRALANEKNLEEEEDGEERCTKNTGQIHRLHNWNLGCH